MDNENAYNVVKAAATILRDGGVLEKSYLRDLVILAADNINAPTNFDLKEAARQAVIKHCYLDGDRRPVKKIAAIKDVRFTTKVGLKEAKIAVEAELMRVFGVSR